MTENEVNVVTAPIEEGPTIRVCECFSDGIDGWSCPSWIRRSFLFSHFGLSRFLAWILACSQSTYRKSFIEKKSPDGDSTLERICAYGYPGMKVGYACNKRSRMSLRGSLTRKCAICVQVERFISVN